MQLARMLYSSIPRRLSAAAFEVNEARMIHRGNMVGRSNPMVRNQCWILESRGRSTVNDTVDREFSRGSTREFVLASWQGCERLVC